MSSGTTPPADDINPSAKASAAAFDLTIGQRAGGFMRSFTALFSLPAAFWIVNLVYTLDGFAYFGVLVRLTPFLTKDVHVADKYATVFTGVFAACVTLFMFGFGSFSEKFGVRRSLIGSFIILTMGRALLCFSPLMPSPWMAAPAAFASLVLMAIGEGVLQTANYSGIKQYSDEKTSAMAFAFNYGIFQVGIMLAGFASPEVRTRVDHLLGLRTATQPLPDTLMGRFASLCYSGEVAVFIMCTAVTLLTLLVCLTMTRRAEANKLRPEDERRIAAQRKGESAVLAALEPFRDARFTFFVFILFPARTLFAHQIHTISLYIERAYPQWVQDRNEWFSNVVNPLTVFIAGPIIASLTTKVHMQRMMVIGTLVTALPTFLLCLGERWDLLLTYMIIFSLGEALWQPRFYQFAADLAPEGKMGAYMAAALIPWLLAKFTTGLYAGWMLSIYCPAQGPKNPAVMWAIYGAIAMISPIGLMLANNWLKAGLHARKVAGFPAIPTEDETA